MNKTLVILSLILGTVAIATIATTLLNGNSYNSKSEEHLLRNRKAKRR